MSGEMKVPVKWGIRPEQMGLTAFVAAELEIDWTLRSKEPVEQDNGAVPSCVWVWESKDGKRWFVALRTGGAGRGRGKVLFSALAYTQEHAIIAIEKMVKTSEVVA